MSIPFQDYFDSDRPLPCQRGYPSTVLLKPRSQGQATARLNEKRLNPNANLTCAPLLLPSLLLLRHRPIQRFASFLCRLCRGCLLSTLLVYQMGKDPGTNRLDMPAILVLLLLPLKGRGSDENVRTGKGRDDSTNRLDISDQT